MNKVFIVAEIGNNHEGSFQNAIKLINFAKNSGADAVKFQIFKTNEFIHPSHVERYNLMKKFELRQKDFLKLQKYANKKKIIFFATPFDNSSLDFLLKINVPFIKIASSDNDNFYMIDKIISKKKKCIVSLGFLSEVEIKHMVNRLIKKFGIKKVNSNLILMHCVSSYPANKKSLNLSVIKRLNELYKFPIGYSDHSIGIEACCTAAGIGAKVIEKHFTLDNNFSSFRDHKLSANPIDMKKMVEKIREIQIMLGSPKKKITKDEKSIIKFCRRSFYLKKSVKRGEIISLDKLIFLRPFKEKFVSLKNISYLLKKKFNKKFKSYDGLLKK